MAAQMKIQSILMPFKLNLHALGMKRMLLKTLMAYAVLSGLISSIIGAYVDIFQEPGVFFITFAFPILDRFAFPIRIPDSHSGNFG